MRKEKRVYKVSNLDKNSIWHYTNLEAAFSIMKNKKLWLTNIRYLNDKNESKYFYEKLFDKLDKIGSSKVNSLRKIFNKCLDNTYVSSFSKEPDMLSQYKYYGKICIGFDSLELMKDIGKCNSETFEIDAEVFYIPEKEYMETINDYIKKEKLICATVQEDYKLINNFFCFVGLIKHPGFKEEKERRIIHYYKKPNNVKYKITRQRRVPYIEMDFSPKSINKIIIGPYNNQTGICEDFDRFIKENEEYNHLKVEKSGIPFIP